ncbi:MAG: helix-turn-helix domain-containing protein [Alcaligenaceae bacterium]|nr:MAG: helix-turn-helix domain-containing protein [Alcaligenaceae bacterium]
MSAMTYQELLDVNEHLTKTVRDLTAQIRYAQAKADNRKKLTAVEVAEIRRMYRNTGFSQREIADIYDVNPATISRTVRGIYHK